jgi:hypothetical protein
MVLLVVMPALFMRPSTSLIFEPNCAGSGVSLIYSGTPIHTGYSEAAWMASARGLYPAGGEDAPWMMQTAISWPFLPASGGRKKVSSPADAEPNRASRIEHERIGRN